MVARNLSGNGNSTARPFPRISWTADAENRHRKMLLPHLDYFRPVT